MLDEGVWAEVKVGAGHLRLFSEHSTQGVQASVYGANSKNWIAPSEIVDDIEQGKDRAAAHDVSRYPKKANSRSSMFDVKLFVDSAGLGRRVAKFRAKEIVITQGDPANQVMYIQEGGVKLTVVNESGKEAVVAILGQGDFIGEG